MEIMIVVSIIGLLAAIAVPGYVHARTTSQMNACIYNMRQIDNAKQSWAMNNNAAPAATPNNTDLKFYLGRVASGALPWCPADTNSTFDTSYNINNLQVAPTCRIAPSNHVYF